jgi:hypothetical protein
LISEADLMRLHRYLTPAQIEALLPAPAWRDHDANAMREHLARLFVSVVPYLPRHLVRMELAQRKEPQQLAGGEFLHGTLMFSDVSGFTALSERLSVLGREGAEQITDIINRYFGQMMSIIFAHGGDVFKFGGDALLVFFPDGPAPGSLAALQASWHMQQAMSEFAEVKTSRYLSAAHEDRLNACAWRRTSARTLRGSSSSRARKSMRRRAPNRFRSPAKFCAPPMSINKRRPT